MSDSRQDVFEKIFKEHLRIETYSRSIDSEPPEKSRHSVKLSLFEASSYEKVCTQAHPEEFQVIGHA